MGHERPRCTVATLRALGVEPKHLPKYGDSVLNELRWAGFGYEHINVWPEDLSIDDPLRTITLKQFIAEHPTGRYVVGTRNHMMALIDGELIDTAEGTGRRRVVLAYRVYEQTEAEAA